MRRKHLIAALVLMAFGIGYGYQTAQLPTRTLPHAPSPSFFPWLLTGALLILAVAVFVQGLRDRTPGVLLAGDRVRLTYPTLGLLLFVGYVATLPYLGFLLASVPFFAGLMILAGERRLRWLLVPCLGVPLVLFLLFRYLFRLPLPRGLFVGWFG